jgi:AmiR/NasT family two-component response regulator
MDVMVASWAMTELPVGVVVVIIDEDDIPLLQPVMAATADARIRAGINRDGMAGLLLIVSVSWESA